MGHCRQETVQDQEIYFLERGRFRPVGPYLIHVALLLILAGGLIGKFWGVDGQLPIQEGEVASAFQVGPQAEQPLNFQVRLDKFQVSYYEPGGSPKEFRSDLTFIKDGKEVFRATCRVNEPVSFGGLTLYQSSYGSQSTGPVRLKVQEGNLSQSIEAPLRQPTDLPGGRGKVIPMKVDGNFQGYGPAVLLAFGPPRVTRGLLDPERPPGVGRATRSLPVHGGVHPLRILFRLPGEARSRGGVGVCRLSPVSPRALPGLLPAGGALGPGVGQNPQRQMAGAPAGGQPPPPGGIRRPPGTAPYGVEARDRVMISQILGSVMLIYLLVAILFLMAELWSSPRLQNAGRFILWLGLGIHTGTLIGRWVESYQLAAAHSPTASFADKLQLIVIQVPLSNFYESLIFFAWCLPALSLLAFRRHFKGYLGALVAILSTLLLAYASFGVDSQIKPLMPALKSNWLLVHVVTAFLGYAAFAVAFGTAILYLFQERRPRPSLPPLPLLDGLIYRTTVLGFLLLTLGIATGAVWAETAWGRYWSWDPKETWSLITWFIYAALLHARLLKGWHGRRIAWLAVLGFMAVLFTYFGVSFLLSGLHSYLT